MNNLLIPIVLKGSLCKNILPEGSFIAIDHFNSPKELAQYLKYLESNKTAYMR